MNTYFPIAILFLISVWLFPTAVGILPKYLNSSIFFKRLVLNFNVQVYPFLSSSLHYLAFFMLIFTLQQSVPSFRLHISLCKPFSVLEITHLSPANLISLTNSSSFDTIFNIAKSFFNRSLIVNVKE